MSAELYQFNVYTPEDAYKQLVTISKDGVRIEGNFFNLGAAPEPVQTIVNFALKKCWLVRPKSKIYMEDGIDPATGFCLSNYPIIPDPDYRLSLWSKTACTGYKLSERMGTETIQGRFTEKWACGDPERQFAVLQWYDPRMKLVTREGTRDGDIYELRRITTTQHNPALFQKPTKFRKVTSEKFYPTTLSPIR